LEWYVTLCHCINEKTRNNPHDTWGDEMKKRWVVLTPLIDWTEDDFFSFWIEEHRIIRQLLKLMPSYASPEKITIQRYREAYYRRLIHKALGVIHG
jgi:hypothetical protein